MTLVILISLAAFVTSSITAAMGVGGGVVLLALMAQFVPPALLIPLHGAAQLMSNTNRVLVQRKHINWAYIRPFLLGALAGGALITPLARYIPVPVGQLLLGLFILLATWKAAWLNLSQWHPAASGGVTTGLSLVLGATGPLVMSVMPKNKWERHMVVGTHGMAMTIQHGIKVIAFASLDVSLIAYWPLLLGIGIATLGGNLFGAKLLTRVPEHQFKTLLDWLLTALALRLSWQGFSALVF
ncbi:MAG: sulfite exporter TauE/SafE family protein [Gammaproteobacteria bacterium]|nr:sulfite exporter TauE/SafE family protein [Gammaproteobacteria bacterium]MBU0848766.1 sulfite exporter TauE/SafE family protein [Gammaproteobacteria bacterium]MBU1267195.1 sulfite exporter TauE/SafE family protein [Gammaproteobacteria bacterium]MBU1527622.1 sulfite exporter TauE/SafE family protein [Gammaproteobacteria bacterium]MBU1779023.1 sulfite exporter TauE/SafE family protein [Gammaproteobacteria bacterium]